MVDLGAIDSYISLEMAKKIHLYTKEKKEPYKLALMNSKTKRDNNGIVIRETLIFTITINKYTKNIKLDIT